jgi:hypothetical protein
MSILSVKTIEHTIAHHGGECVTQEWTYPRPMHPEVMTHRVLSRNAESSRAVPVLKKLEKTSAEPWIPKAFTRNQKGMQGGAALDGIADATARFAWEMGFRVIEPFVKALAGLEVHKQYANRLAEPWATITIVVTATEWDNMDALRVDPNALPEFQELMWMAIEERIRSRETAYRVKEQMIHDPMMRSSQNWHLPYVSRGERLELGSTELAIKCSTARCARVSFLLHDGTTPNVEKDLELYDRLFTGGHMSPFEHQATPAVERMTPSGNFKGFTQYRKLIPNEIRTFNYWDACEQYGRTPIKPRPSDEIDDTDPGATAILHVDTDESKS